MQRNSNRSMTLFQWVLTGTLTLLSLSRAFAADELDPRMRGIFMKSCTANCEQVHQGHPKLYAHCAEVCQCALDRIHETYTYAQFPTIPAGSPVVKESAEYCRQKVFGMGTKSATR